MQTDSDNLFTGDSWETLPEKVKQTYEPCQQIIREYGDPEDADCDEGTYKFVKHVLWLVPLAEALRQRTELHGLYPAVHHAVIEIKRLPHSTPQNQCFMFYAETETEFRLSRLEWQTHSQSYDSQELGRGNAEAVVELFANIVREIPE